MNRLSQQQREGENTRDVDWLVSQIDVLELLDSLDLLGHGKLEVKGHRVVGPCVMPTHINADNPTAFNFDLDKKLYYCFTKCGAGGDVIDFIMKYLGLSFREAMDYLRKHLGIEPTEIQGTRGRRRHSRGKQREIRRHPEQLTEYPHLHLYPSAPSWVEAEVGKEILETFDLRYTQWGFYKYRILWPIHDHEGRVVGMTGRTVLPPCDEEPKWLHTPSLKTSQVIFNLNRVLQYRKVRKGEPLYLCEGTKDVARLWQYGYRTAGALLGKTMSPEQAWLVTEHFESVHIALDNDPSGVKAAVSIGKQLREVKPGMEVMILPLPLGKDPDETTREEFEQSKQNAVDVERFIQAGIGV